MGAHQYQRYKNNIVSGVSEMSVLQIFECQKFQQVSEILENMQKISESYQECHTYLCISRGLVRVLTTDLIEWAQCCLFCAINDVAYLSCDWTHFIVWF